MKKITMFITILSIALLSVSCLAGPANSSTPPDLPQANIVTNQISADDQEVEKDVVEENMTTAGTGLLTAEEIKGLVYMREEEKLAHDLYLSFYEKWGLPLFQNIASSEQAHVESVAFLLEKYGIPDSAANQTTGFFTNPVLQDLYDQLLASGSLSVGDALKAGAAVEEVDILDLRERSGQSGMSDILRVYQNLESGSNNHLRAFTSVLENQTGEIYSPTYLSLEDYQQIISGGMQTNGQGPGSNNGRKGPQTN